jgi:uncharacterized protein YdhG (YjbR/CyaY superfamily)
MNLKPHQFKDIDDYISSFPADLRELLKEIRMTIRRAVPPAKEAIKYNMPAFILNNRAVYFGVFKQHIGFYPAPKDVPGFEDETKKYQSGKGSLRFPLQQPMPLELIARLAINRLKPGKDIRLDRRQDMANKHIDYPPM